MRVVSDNMSDTKENKLTSRERQRNRVLKHPWYAPGRYQNGYKQKVIKKISYCEDFMYFLHNSINMFGISLCDYDSFSDVVRCIKTISSVYNGCNRSYGDGEYCGNVIYAIAYDITEFSKRKVEIMFEALNLIIPKPLINMISNYYHDYFSDENIVTFCYTHYYLENHWSDNIPNPNFRYIIKRDNINHRWCISTAKSPESLLS